MRNTVTAQEIIQLEAKYIVPTYSRPPFVLDRGEGVYLYDTTGKAYLDFVSGIAVNALGYGDAGLLSVLQEQSQKLWHVSNLYHTAPHVHLARSLCENSFADRVFFCNSGAEAVEAALKFARKWSRETQGEGKTEVVAFSGSFHGRTMGALAATAREQYQAPFAPLMPGVRFAPFNDAEAAAEAITPATCAVIVEPVQGEGGVHPAEAEFLRALRRRCDEQGALLIFDEVQCGLGRTGTLWAHEPSGVMPDIMTLAKPLGGGLPIGATLVTEAVARVMQPGDHGSTFAAGPLVCAVALAVFERVRQPAFLAHVREVGDYLGARLQALADRSPLVVEVRGRGLIWGLELTVPAKKIVAAGFEAGVLTVPAGERVLRLVPPLVIEKQHVDALLEYLTPLLAG
jgi:acetylornithine/N-succinyldiaminopimelate aminotransferase